MNVNTSSLGLPIAEGGEGFIYEFDKNTLLKIFKPHVDIREKQEKVNILMKKNLPDTVIKPIDLVFDQKKNFIGYKMKKVIGEEMRKLSNKKFVSEHKIEHSFLIELLKKIYDSLKALHAERIFIGDLNDSNILFDEHGDIFFIDCDSWSIEKFRCQVCMDSFKDPLLQANHFNSGTDTFAFSVLAFKTLTRLHPYGGTMDPDIPLLERMKKGMSVLHVKNVKIPRTVNDWSVFSSNIIDMFKNVFSHQNRDLSSLSFHQLTLQNDKVAVKTKPEKIQINTGKIPISILLAPNDSFVFINKNYYVNQSNEYVHVKSGKKVKPNHMFEDVYVLENEMNSVIRSNHEEIMIENDSVPTIFEKAFRTKVVALKDKFYYIHKNRNLVEVTVTKKGNYTKTLTKTSTRHFYDVFDNGHYYAANLYDHLILLQLNQHTIRINKDTKNIDSIICFYDVKTNKWLVVIKNKNDHDEVIIYENQKITFESNDIIFQNPELLCFDNDVIFKPGDGFIRGYQPLKNQYKDFPCSVAREDSILYRKGSSFIVITGKEIYKVG